jgi:hypothetical protein
VAATNKVWNLKRTLSSATCALLGTVPAAHAGKLDLWDLETSVLSYSEGGGRVSAIEPVIGIAKRFNDGKEVGVKFTVDVLTGATPSGATATNVPQTFTRPSGKGSYKINAGDIPLDDTFHDTRFAVNGSWKQPLNRLTALTLSANFSTEEDFVSLGGSAQLARDFNEKNTTVMAGVSTEIDQVKPVGGVPIPFAAMAPAGTPQPRGASGDNKKVLDGIFGLTQVVNRRTLMQFNYSLSRLSGYLNDPYKILSRIDPNTGSTVDNVYENRPDSRTRHAFFWLTRYHLKRDVVSASYRYFFDDWGVRSHTLDLNYNWKLSERQYLEPRFRFYTQTQADFFKVNLVNGEALPTNATPDYRLAKYHGFTYGLKWGWQFKNQGELVLRLEYYTQIGESHPDSAIGVQRGLDLYPDLQATIFQVQYKF